VWDRIVPESPFKVGLHCRDIVVVVAVIDRPESLDRCDTDTGVVPIFGYGWRTIVFT